MVQEEALKTAKAHESEAKRAKAEIQSLQASPLRGNLVACFHASLLDGLQHRRDSVIL